MCLCAGGEFAAPSSDREASSLCPPWRPIRAQWLLGAFVNLIPITRDMRSFSSTANELGMRDVRGLRGAYRM